MIRLADHQDYRITLHLPEKEAPGNKLVVTFDGQPSDLGDAPGTPIQVSRLGGVPVRSTGRMEVEMPQQIVTDWPKGEVIDPETFEEECPPGICGCNFCGGWFFPHDAEEFCETCIAMPEFASGSATS